MKSSRPGKVVTQVTPPRAIASVELWSRVGNSFFLKRKLKTGLKNLYHTFWCCFYSKKWFALHSSSRSFKKARFALVAFLKRAKRAIPSFFKRKSDLLFFVNNKRFARKPKSAFPTLLWRKCACCFHWVQWFLGSFVEWSKWARFFYRFQGSWVHSYLGVNVLAFSLESRVHSYRIQCINFIPPRADILTRFNNFKFRLLWVF